MRILLLIIVFLFIVLIVNAQDTTAIKRMVCRFKVTRTSGSPEYGTGFILGHQNDTLYLATAGHVLRYRAKNAPIIVTIGDSADTLHACIKLYRDTDNGDSEDLAICSVVAKGYEYPKFIALDTLRTNMPVFYYHNEHLYAESGEGDQLLITRNKKAHTYKVYMPDVQGGDSGGPVFTSGASPYLTGIVISGDRSCEVLCISQILDIVKKELPPLNP
ncbi:trypsin [Mucilaginibacter oryzae]|uniref:Trypsin n=1 Tax=Mucilaginibacter oryzae TaxID=468058 RepID=A0A316H9J6_9SPHI|nr:trypsin-like serine protease [Mucilaginibacter oryzae]PWK77186.1 trypsin [Mucilaginibacter oryzae]